MKYLSYFRQGVWVALASLTLLTSGCVREDLDECYKLTLKVLNFKEEDITGAGYMATASLYIFDENLNFLETRKLDREFIQSRQEIVLDNYTADRQLRIVAWSNVNVLGEKQDVANAKTIEELKVMLKNQDGLAVTPDSLYYGSQLVKTKVGGVAQNTEIIVRPKIGSVTIDTYGLQEELARRGIENVSGCQFTLNNTLSGFDYEGTQIGDSVYYKPEGVWDESGKEWKTAVMQNACPGTDMSVSISANGVSLGTGYVDSQYNEPIQVKPGEETLLRLSWEDGTLSVRMTVRPWGTVEEDIPLH